MKRLVLIAALLVPFALSTTALATEPHQVLVCKYVGTPGVDERLQTGQNPIVVDTHALEDGFDGTFPFEFSDAQGRSVAIRYLAEGESPGDDFSIEECPGAESPSPPPSESESPPPSESESPPPSESLIPPTSFTRSPGAPGPSGTAFTGVDAGVLGLVALAFLLVGAAVLRFSSRETGR